MDELSGIRPIKQTRLIYNEFLDSGGRYKRAERLAGNPVEGHQREAGSHFHAADCGLTEPSTGLFHIFRTIRGYFAECVSGGFLFGSFDLDPFSPDSGQN